jgi:hypothetical protein
MISEQEPPRDPDRRYSVAVVPTLVEAETLVQCLPYRAMVRGQETIVDAVWREGPSWRVRAYQAPEDPINRLLVLLAAQQAHEGKPETIESILIDSEIDNIREIYRDP